MEKRRSAKDAVSAKITTNYAEKSVSVNEKGNKSRRKKIKKNTKEESAQAGPSFSVVVRIFYLDERINTT